MASIVSTPSGRWKAVVRLRGCPTTCRTFRLRRDACAWARQMEVELAQGRRPVTVILDEPPLSHLLDRYAATTLLRKSPRTQCTDAGRLKVLRKHLGAYSLRQLTPTRIAEFRDQRLATPCRRYRNQKVRRNEFLSTGTVRQELLLLRHVISVARREWRMGPTSNPFDEIDLPPPCPGRNRRLTAGEEMRLCRAFAAYSNPCLGFIFRLALETAMRASEIATLTLDNVDLVARTVLLPKTKNQSARTVPLSRQATLILRMAVALDGRPADCPFVFFSTSPTSRPDRPYRFQHAWWRVLSRIGMVGLRFHDLRHEAISRLVEAGLGDLEVAAISGHRGLQMLRRYTHLRTAHLVQRLDAIERKRNRQHKLGRSHAPNAHLEHFG